MSRFFLPFALAAVGWITPARSQETPAEASEQLWRAGVARVKITPDSPMWMAGYGARTRPAAGTLGDLWGKVLVLDDGKGGRAVLITLDLVGIDRDLARAVCEPLMERFGLRRDQIAICCSHTHSGPALWRNLAPLHYLVVDPGQQRLIKEYTAALAPKIVATAAEALGSLAPARVSWGSGTADFAVNRRANRPEDVASARRRGGELAGPVNHDVPVLAVRRAGDASLAAIVFGYACHSTTLSSYNWSGDYPGFAQAELEASHPNCTALFWAGCGGDQNPLPRSAEALVRHYGKRLATAVDKVLLTTEMSGIQGRLVTSFEELPLPLEALPTPEQLQRDAASQNRYVAARARMLLDRIDAGDPLAASYPYPVGVWKLGSEAEFVFLGGETVIDYSNRLQRERRGKRTWIAGYSNDVMAYIPSERVHAEGGYEGGDAMVYYGLPSNWKAGLEELIVSEVQRQAGGKPLGRIKVGPAGDGFINEATGEAFTIWGVNYDHNEKSQLIEEYWLEDWDQVADDFAEIKDLGANTVRIHLQLGRFMTDAGTPDAANLAKLEDLLTLAEEHRLHLDLTGLGCYRKAGVPEWYDALQESDRWDVQARFWEAVAGVCAGRPVVLCYDLMNEPILDGGDGAGWLAGELGGFHFVQRITRDLAGRKGPEVARDWSGRLRDAIRRHDPDTMITVGVIPWAHVFPNAKPLFYSEEARDAFDFVSVHFYPKAGSVQAALDALKVYAIGKPLVIEEMFPLACSQDELVEFVDESKKLGTDGWVSFYWGTRADEYDAATLPGAIKANWLNKFKEIGIR